jgi:hypothetical protein
MMGVLVVVRWMCWCRLLLPMIVQVDYHGDGDVFDGTEVALSVLMPLCYGEMEDR